jgi:uncharacterized repeat protein (TIGR03803 family)
MAFALVAPTAVAAAKMQILYSFPATTEGYPYAGLTMDSAGNLYGTASGDGDGEGAVFELARKHGGGWTENTLYSFCSQENCTDGDLPLGGVILDAAGNAYGTTVSGGANDQGTVFRISPAGKEKVLYSFCKYVNGCIDGASPQASLIADKQGNLYGTVSGGGNNDYGAVFEVTPKGKEKVLYSFCAVNDCADGGSPEGNLMADKEGNLYGTTYHGGQHGEGTVFELATSGQETVLYSFCSQGACADGANPSGGLITDSEGNIFGTTDDGGADDVDCGSGCGTVFKLTSKGKETVLHSFCSLAKCNDGVTPESNLILDKEGNLYGTTGGNVSTAFKLTAKGRLSVLSYLSFSSSWFIKKGNTLYGTEYQGGDNNAGAVFDLAE